MNEFKSKSVWMYSTDAPDNKKWQKDRAEFFAKNGNGWWYTQGVHSYNYAKRKEMRRLMELEEEEADNNN